jgi:translocation and assembly module TamA
MAQYKPSSRACRRHRRAPAAVLCLVLCQLAHAAGVKVEVRGVDELVRTNVLAYLSFERYRKGGAELNADTVERLHERVEREVQAALRPFGYYEPKVDSTVTDLGHEDWRVVVNIVPGQPVLIDHIDVRVDGPGESDPQFQRIVRHVPSAGTRLNHADYEAIKTELQRTAATYGYFDAKMVRNELVVDPPNHKANIALELDSGERYRFGKTTIKQEAIKDGLVRRYLRYHEGDLFDLTQVLHTQFALDDARYFVNLEVQPGDPDRQAHTVPVDIHGDPRRKNNYSFAPGYATDTGARVTLGFTDPLLNTSGHSFSLEVQAAQVTRYNVQARYAIPIGDPAVENFALRAQIEQQTLADVTAYTQAFGPTITAVRGGWQAVGALNAVHTTSETINSTQTDSLLVPEIDFGSVPKGYYGEALFEHPLFAELRGSDTALGADSNFLQLHAQAEHVFRIAPGWHLLLRDEIGASLVSGFSSLPAIYRFFAGGDNSVRGFYFNELSPVEAVCARNATTGQIILAANGSCQQVPGSFIKVGGKDMVTGTVEVIRDLPRNLGVATFVDYGNAFDHFGTHLYCSVGVGLRVRLPVMTVGIDVAQPLNMPGAGPRLHINFSPKL